MADAPTANTVVSPPRTPHPPSAGFFLFDGLESPVGAANRRGRLRRTGALIGVEGPWMPAP